MTIMASQKRFYVGNLASDIKENDLEKLFKKFGNVDKVEIKNKTDIDGKVLTTFAFVSLNELAEDDVVKCIQKLNNTIWKKQTIKVRQAQESFLSRLQREREEAAKPKQEKANFVDNEAQKSLEFRLRSLAERKVFDDEEYDAMQVVKESVKADDKAVITFDNEVNDENQEKRVNKLERTKQVRVYHSSSEEEDEDDDEPKAKKAKRNENADILKKLECFDGGFWKDDEVDIDPRIKRTEKKCEDKEVVVESKGLEKNLFGQQTNQGTGTFSLLSTFGQKQEAKDEKEHEITDTFALKLKEKAALEASKGHVEPFFFFEGDKRLQEAEKFLQLKESMNEVRTKYEEKRPILASIMKKKLKNRAKRQEKMTFGVKKGKRKFNPKFSKKSNNRNKKP